MFSLLLGIHLVFKTVFRIQKYTPSEPANTIYKNWYFVPDVSVQDAEANDKHSLQKLRCL